MKVMVVNPPWRSGGRLGVRAGSRWPHLKLAEEERYMPFPFYMAYATALLKKEGFDAKAVDAIAEGLSSEEFEQEVKRFSPDILFSEVSTPSLDNDMKILGRIKKLTQCKIGIVGPDINLSSESFLLENEIDFTCIGEYERTLLSVAQAIKSKSGFFGIKGIVFKHGKEIINNGHRTLDKDIDTLPWPDRSDFNLLRYHDCPGGIPEPSAQMWASRGCPYECKFCAWPQIMYNGNNYRARNVVDLVDEMEYLIKKRGMKSIYFDDDTFNIGKKRMLRLGEELHKRDFHAPWAFMGRADLADEEYMKVFRSVGLKAVKYGMESGVQSIVDSANKRLDLKLAIRNIESTKKLGIKVHLTFTLGLPGETKETMRKTMMLAAKLDPDSVQFSIATPFPGTRFYEEMKNSGSIISEDWQDYDGNSKSVIRTESLGPEDLVSAQERAYRVWREHKYLKQRYSKISPFRLFDRCLRENGLGYTLKKTYSYIKDRRYSGYFRRSADDGIKV